MVCFRQSAYEMDCSPLRDSTTFSGLERTSNYVWRDGVRGRGMHIARHFTTAGRDPYETVPFRTASSEIRNPDGSVVFAGRGDRGAGRVEPGRLRHPRAEILPQGRCAGASGAGCGSRAFRPGCGGAPPMRRRSRRWPRAPVTAAKPAPARSSTGMAGTWTYWGWKGGYFDTEEDARAFYDEIRLMLARQIGAPNSPQWFNTGLHWAYGIDGPAQGHYYVDHQTGELHASDSAYEHPQPHACFIQSVADDLVNEGGIMDLWVREARLFKYGSGSGSNFSKIARRRRAAVGRRPLLRADELSARSATAPPARSNPAARRGAPPRWSSSTSTIPTSRPSSTGRSSRSRRSPRSSPARSSPPGT